MRIDYLAINKTTENGSYSLPPINGTLNDMSVAVFSLRLTQHRVNTMYESVHKTDPKLLFKRNWKFSVPRNAFWSRQRTSHISTDNECSRQGSRKAPSNSPPETAYRETLRQTQEMPLWTTGRQEEIKFCGFLIAANGIHSIPDKVDAITNWLTPHNAKEVS